MISGIMLYAGLASAGEMEPHETLPSDLKDREIVFTVPRIEYRQDFLKGSNHEEGIYLYVQSMKPSFDFINFTYVYARSEFRFRREDGLSDVLLIETSPSVSGKGLKGMLFRVDGIESVSLAYGCNDDRQCEEQYRAMQYFNPEAGIVSIRAEEAFHGSIEFPLRGLLRMGRKFYNRMDDKMYEPIRVVDKYHVLADEISSQLPHLMEPINQREVTKVVRKKNRLERKLKRD